MSIGLEVTEGHRAQVGDITVRRALPRRGRRTIGAWCFADHMGPVEVTETHGLDVGPHPHLGLRTVTWLTDGEVLHRDSLGTDQIIRPGQLNLMTAGHGVSHSEEATGRYVGRLQGIQLWIAQSDASRHGQAAFEHHADLPTTEIGGTTVTVLVGSLGGIRSPAQHGDDLMGAELDLHTSTTIGLDARFEHGLIVLDGAVHVGGVPLVPGQLGHLAPGADELRVEVDASATVILLGGVPFEEELLMWWNFGARTRSEIDEAFDAWLDDDGRFGTVASELARVTTAPPHWRRGDLV